MFLKFYSSVTKALIGLTAMFREGTGEKLVGSIFDSPYAHIHAE